MGVSHIWKPSRPVRPVRPISAVRSLPSCPRPGTPASLVRAPRPPAHVPRIQDACNPRLEPFQPNSAPTHAHFSPFALTCVRDAAGAECESGELQRPERAGFRDVSNDLYVP